MIATSSTLSIAQCNVQHCSAYHDTFLSSCALSQVDIILIQEPWIHSDLDLMRTRYHPAYQLFIASGAWQMRPRVATYIRIASNIPYAHYISPVP